jgi:hypothetical protein
MTIVRTRPIAGLLVAGLLTAALAAPAAIARPAIDRHVHSPGASPYSITFTNPLGRSRGPGAGGGLL